MIPAPEVYWLAGLLEGEGSFMAGLPSRRNSPIISIAMADADVIQRAAALLGVHSIYAREDTGKAQDSYQFHLRGSKAAAVMRQLQPLMGLRRQGQIARALASYDPDYRKHHPGKLSEDQVLEIYRRAHVGERPQAIAQDLGISYSICMDIKLGRTWAELTGHTPRLEKMLGDE